MQECSIDKLISSSSKTNYEIQKTTADLQRQKILYNTVTLSRLPDKGAKIKSRINELENLLKDLTIAAGDGTEISSGVKDDKTKSDFSLIAKDEKSDSSTVKEVKIKSNFSLIAKDKKSDSSNITDIKKTKSNSPATVKDHTQETSKDSGFDDSQSDSSSRTLNILKSSVKEFPSFQELSKKAEKSEPDPLKEVAQSPAFKTYRETKLIPKVKLTEAKPLFQEDKPVKRSNNFYSEKRIQLFADEEVIKKLHGSLASFPDDCKEEKQPRQLKTTLLKHQIKALPWLIWREAQIPSGGIFADDMGLGKTLTMIALILKQRENFIDDLEEKSDEFTTKGTLVVCLASIIRQWESEITKHCKKNSVQCLVYHGANRSRDVMHMKKFDVVLTTYQILLSERKAMLKAGTESGLFDLKWERIVLDEAHTIKNHASQTAEAVFSLKGLKKWCVTGTPIHNDFKDMYSLVKFLQFHPFDDYKRFKKLTDDKTDDFAERRSMLVKSILLRRTKTEVDESGKPLVKMVKKNMSITYIDLSPEEQKVYEELHKKITNIIRRVIDNDSKKVHNTSSLLVLFLRVQQCCCHLSLLNRETEEESVDDSLGDISKSLKSLSISSPNKNSDSSLDLTFSEYENHSMYDKSVMSSKLRKLFEELDKIAEESKNRAKCVIVSQWVSMLKLVEYHLKCKNKLYDMISGSTKTEERQRISEDFNYNPDSCKIMLLSLKAGGVGLNLVGANHLFLLDLHWNPALEMQACDRIHRVGQENDVFIHKFVCRKTIEEKILSLQNAKSKMAINALSGAGKVKKGLSIDDFRMLFNI